MIKSLIVGTPDCPIQFVSDAMVEAIFEVRPLGHFQEKWKELVLSLAESFVNKSKEELTETLKIRKSVHELLEIWTKIENEGATVEQLLDAMKNCDLADVASGVEKTLAIYDKLYPKYLIIGSKECPFDKIIMAMSKSRQFFECSFAINQIYRKLKLEHLLPRTNERCMPNMWLDLYRVWKYESKSRATLGRLLAALDECDFKDVSNEIRKEFNIEYEEDFLQIKPCALESETTAKKRKTTTKDNPEDGHDPQENFEVLQVSPDGPKSVLQWITKSWLSFMENQTNKTARDPFARRKLFAWVFILAIVFFNIPSGHALKCDPCVTFSATFCAAWMTLGGVCAGAQIIHPVYCAVTLAAGGSVCTAAATTCSYFCFQEISRP